MSKEKLRKREGEGFKNIWSLALEESRLSSRTRGEIGKNDSHVFFVGSKNSGKTTIILRFLDREESAKPTTALEYTFGRRAQGTNFAKDVTHIWELGGGTHLAKLLDVPISAETISTLSVMIVLDLSKPEELWSTLSLFLTHIKQRTSSVLSEIKETNRDLATQLRKRAWQRYGEDHPDQELVSPLLVPVTIVGTKYDVFQDYDPEKKKIISKTLRFMAHMNGASLLYFSSKSDVLVNRTKQLINHFAFGVPLNHMASMDHTKPLVVPAGSDALGQIGVPSLTSGDLERISAKNPVELWRQAYCGFYPQVSTNPQHTDDPCKDPKYHEPSVDSMRTQKDEELERYRRQSERRARGLASESTGVI